MNPKYHIILFTCVALIIISVVTNKLPLDSNNNSSAYAQSPDSTASDAITASRQNAITRTVATCSPAVVGINVTEIQEYTYRDPFGNFFSDPFFEQFFGRSQPNRPDRKVKQEIKGLGSGFIVSSDGYIVTNDHVAGKASKIVITMTNGEKFDAEKIGTDPASDIALLKIKGKNLPFLKLGNSDNIIVGEWAIAFGNPFGLFEVNDKPTVTVGVISNTKMNLSERTFGRSYRDMIQTDAAINSGNSGGPLVNASGEVIAVNASIISPNQGSVGLGFGIPINKVKKVIEKLKRGETSDHNYWTGLGVQDIDESLAKYFKLDKAEGVVVTEIAAESPASRANFESGDVIVKVNGEAVRSEDDLNSIFASFAVGDKVKVTVQREGKTRELTLTLEKRKK